MRSTQQASQNFVINFFLGLYVLGALCYASWYLWVHWASSESVITTGLYALVRSIIWPVWLLSVFVSS